MQDLNEQETRIAHEATPPAAPARPIIAVVQISPRRALIVLGITTAILTLLGVTFEFAAHRWPDAPGVKRLSRLFGLNGEANLPAWYSSGLWLCAAYLAWAIAMFQKRTSRRLVGHWIGFAAVCVFLSADEAAMIHETMGDAIGKVFRKWRSLRLDGGWLYSWMYWGIGFLLTFLLVYRKFLLALPRRVLVLLVVAGATYTTGALGLEAVSAWADHDKIAIDSHAEWTLLIAAEETLEMTGVVLLIFALLTYTRSEKVQTAVAA